MKKSVQTLLYWLAPTGWAIGLFILSSMSFAERPPTYPHEDKVIHLLLYANLGLLLLLALLRERGWNPRRAAMIAFVMTSLYGMTDEFHQYFVPTRSCDWRDWLADTAGAAIVFAVAAHEQKRIQTSN